LFNGAFPLVARFYGSTALGAVRFPDLMGSSTGMAASVVTAVALAGFFLAGRIERSRA
jgi:hypothetical protein